MLNLVRYEPFDDDELAFIQRRYDTASKPFYLGMRWFLKITILVPVLILLLHFFFPNNDEISNAQVWFYAQLIMLLIFLLAFTAGYMRFLFSLVRDLHQKQKTIETVTIHEKKFMPQNNSYHFYIYSKTTVSIEVDAATFLYYEVNDSLNIEYARHTQIFLGYF
jgi:uncharacterized integral membrane protein